MKGMPDGDISNVFEMHHRAFLAAMHT